MSIRLIQQINLSSTATALTFSNIPNTFTDLKLSFSARTNANAIDQQISVFLNDDGSGYSFRALYSNGQTVFSAGGSSTAYAIANGATSTNNTFSNGEIYFSNYAGAANKSYSIDQVTENNGTFAWQFIIAGLWSNTNAINKINLQIGSGEFQIGSSAYLYGITRA